MWKFTLALISITILAGCQKSPTEGVGTAITEGKRRITVAYTFQPQSTLVHIAAAKGYFAQEGLEVQPLMKTYGKAALQAVLDDQADFATVAETPVMFAILKGEKIFVVAGIESSNKNNAIVARRSAGISVPRDIKNKRVGVTPGTSGDFFLDSWLTANGLLRKDIHTVALMPEEILVAMLAKTVDAVSTWNYPLTETRRALGPDGIVFYDQQIYTETFNIAARQAFVMSNPGTVRSFLAALLRAEDFVRASPDEARSILADRTKVDRSIIDEVWDSFTYSLTQDQTLLITLEDETRWAMKNRLTEQTVMPDYEKFIHLDSLRAIKPEAVRIRR